MGLALAATRDVWILAFEAALCALAIFPGPIILGFKGRVDWEKKDGIEVELGRKQDGAKAGDSSVVG
jgi:hypothetical protein